MADTYNEPAPRLISDAEMNLVADIQREFAQMVLPRVNFESHWEEIAALIDPMSVGTFNSNNYVNAGEKKTDKQVDASGMMANSRFAAICDSLLTPRNMMWHGLAANDDYVMKDRDSRLWFEAVTKLLFKYRYNPLANFSSQNQSIYRNLGAYGTGAMFIDALDMSLGHGKGLRYKSLPMGQIYLRENHQGLIDGFFRVLKLTAYQAYQKWPDTFPDVLRAALKNGSQNLYMFVQRVCPRTGYDKERLDYKGKPYASTYISVEGKCVVQEGGYNSLPLAGTRYEQAAGEVYGRSPAMMVLPALKTLNAEKRVFLTQGHRAGSPVLLTSDDGIMDFSMRPGAMNKGGVTSDGKPLVHALPTGDIQITKEMMQEEKVLINDAFLVTLFQILTETPQMSATEVIERTNEKGILLAPTVGRQQSEYLGPMIDRELDVLAELRLLPPMPGRLKEAQGEYQTVYTSPMSRAMRAQEAAGFMRTLEVANQVVSATGDPSYYDPFNFEVALPEIADINGVQFSWMSSPEQMADKKQKRAQAQARAEKVQAMPAEAAMMKAQAVAAKANPGQPGQGAPAAPLQQ